MPIFAFVAVRLPKIAVTAFNSVVKKLVEVPLLIMPLVEKRFVIDASAIVVVASLVKPSTTKSFVDVDPDGSERKLRFSTQETPFQ